MSDDLPRITVSGHQILELPTTTASAIVGPVPDDPPDDPPIDRWSKRVDLATKIVQFLKAAGDLLDWVMTHWPFRTVLPIARKKRRGFA